MQSKKTKPQNNSFLKTQNYLGLSKSPFYIIFISVGLIILISTLFFSFKKNPIYSSKLRNLEPNPLNIAIADVGDDKQYKGGYLTISTATAKETLFGEEFPNVEKVYYCLDTNCKKTDINTAIEFNGQKLTIFFYEKLTDLNEMFAKKNYIKEIDFANLYTNDITNMNKLFFSCPNLISCNFGEKFTGEKVTSMEKLFFRCDKLPKADLSFFKTTSLKEMSYMFTACHSIKEIKFGENFTTEKVVSMQYLFFECGKLTELDISKFKSNELTTMEFMFFACENLTSVKFGENFTVEKVKNMERLFQRCEKLPSVDFSYFNTKEVTTMEFMFFNCISLTNVKFGDNFTIEKVKNIERIFQNCYNIENIDMSKFKSNELVDMGYMFKNCYKLKNIKFGPEFTTEKVETMYALFKNCTSLKKVDLSKFKSNSLLDMSYMFSDCHNLESYNFSPEFTGEKVITMTHLFENCISLTSIDFSNFISGDLVDLTYVFLGCTRLKKVKFGEEFTARKVDNMYEMFRGCLSLTSVDLSKFHPKVLLETANMFYDCVSLVQVKFHNNLILKDMRHMENMFYNCNNTCFQCVDMSGFNIPDDVKADDFKTGANNLKVIVNKDNAKPIYEVLDKENKKLLKNGGIKCKWVDNCVCFGQNGECNKCDDGFKLRNGGCLKR